MSEVIGGKPSKWLESLMREVQLKILNRASEIETAKDLERVTTEEMQKVSNDLTLTLQLVGNTLQQVPIEFIKQR